MANDNPNERVWPVVVWDRNSGPFTSNAVVPREMPDRDIAEGRLKRFASMAELIADLKKERK